MVNLSVGLKKYGFETLLVVGTPDISEGSMEPWARSMGAQVCSIQEFQAPISFRKDLKALIQLVCLFWRERPDIVHTHTFKAGLLGRVAAWVTGVPVIVHTYHGHLLTGYWHGIVNKIVVVVERGLGLLTSRTIAVSKQVANDLVGAGIVSGEKVSVVELGFDVDSLSRALEHPPKLRSDLGIDASAEVVGIVGRLVPVKGVDIFLRALAPLLVERPHLHLVIIGDGAESEKLKALAKSLSSERIHFCGWRTPSVPDLPDLDLCVCSSHNEGTSVSIIEAVIAGVPVVSTQVGGMGDLLGNGRWGDLVPVDENALRVQVRSRLELLTVASSDKQRMAWREKIDESSRVFKKRFSSERLLREVNDIYCDLLSTPKIEPITVGVG